MSFLPSFLLLFFSPSLPPFLSFFSPSFLHLFLFSLSFFQFFSLKSCQSSLTFTASMNGRYIDFPYNLCHYPCIRSPIINNLHQSNTFVLTDETIFTYCDHPKSTAYIVTHSSYCAFYGFGQRYCKLNHKTIKHLLWYHTEHFHCPKIPLCAACSFPPLFRPISSKWWQKKHKYNYSKRLEDLGL